MAGVPFQVEWGSGSGTGYQWEVTSLPEGMQVVRSEFRQAPDAAIGDGGTQVFTLRTERAGRLALQFALKRRWETDALLTRTVVVEAH